MHYVNQGCPGQLPLAVHIQLFQPAYSCDKESVWKCFPLAAPSAVGASRYPRQMGCISFPLSFPAIFCRGQICTALAWGCLPAEQYEREPPMKAGRAVTGNAITKP